MLCGIFSIVAKSGGCSSVVMHRLLTVGASLVAEHGPSRVKMSVAVARGLLAVAPRLLAVARGLLAVACGLLAVAPRL